MIEYSLDEAVRAYNDDAESSGEDAAISRDSCFGDVQTSPTSRSSEYLCFGNRFQVNIPKGSIINTAYWEGYIYSSILGNIACDIYGHLIGNAPDFLANEHIWNAYSRPRTKASVEWVQNGLEGWHGIELKDIIQELVNQNNWMANNALVLLFIAKVQETIKHARFYSWNYELPPATGIHAYPPKLHIEYSSPTPSKVSGLAADAISRNSFRLSWAESPIQEEVNSYRLYLTKV